MNKERRTHQQVENEENISQDRDELKEKIDKITRQIPDEERILRTTHLKEADQNIVEQVGIEPYPLSIFSTSELIGDNKKAGAYCKLTIQKELLLPELAEQFAHVTAPTIEFNVWMINNLEEQKRKRILKTIAEWEKETGLKVRFEGVVGK
jgi:hypothetical protein